jgi:acyl-CoA carboxylase subunit alpha
MISSVLVANRAEIARRVFATCRRLGISTVAVFSDPDAGSLHVQQADLAATYLNAERIIAAALAAGVDAVHPGYGFLSENAVFAQAVVDAGLVWIGPSPKAIAAMGSKIEAKRLMVGAGVPVLPEIDPGRVSAADLPILVKASAGGGGRGMRVVRDAAALPAELATARAEALAAFGDPAVFCEPYLAAGRHIEVQILADRHGTVWPLSERECSIQRRHQKVIEEAPSPLVDRIPGMRERLFEAAVAAAKSVDYLGAGTVEFLADGAGRFFFLEMNTRLQVEHPVTECITRVDLVAWQFRIADGAALPVDPPATAGHSIEARLYAEDPAHGWRPQSGTIHRFEVRRGHTEFEPPGEQRIRVDAGVGNGSEVTAFYDPMLAKVISWAPSRPEAARSLASTLAGLRLHGVLSNRDLLVRVLRDPVFLGGDVDTSFLDEPGLARLADPTRGNGDRIESWSAAAAALAQSAMARAVSPVVRGLPSGWRNVGAHPQRRGFATATAEYPVEYRFVRGQAEVIGHPELQVCSVAGDLVVFEIGSVLHRFEVAHYPQLVVVDSVLGSVALRPLPRFSEPGSQHASGSLLAPMPGTVLQVPVQLGDRVSAGATLLVLEAMKMQHTVTAPSDGIVAEVAISAGQQVAVGDVLVVLSDPVDPQSRVEEEQP